MKWIYIILIVAVVGGLLSSEKLRGYVFSSESGTEPAAGTTAGERPTSARLEEAGGISAMHGEVAR